MPSEDQREGGFGGPRTVLSFEGGPRLDPRWELAEDERRALAKLELGPTFAILTAESRDGHVTDGLSAEQVYERQRESARRTLRLEEHLALEGVPFRRVDGMAPDGTQVERCVAVALPRVEAGALARDHDQVALFWYDGERFWPWSPRVEAAPAPAPGG